MLKLSAVFAVIAVLAAVYGFGLADASTNVSIAKVLFGVFTFLFLCALFLGFTMFRRK